MKTSLIISLIVISMISVSSLYAAQAPEVLYLLKDKPVVKSFLLSNSLHDSDLEINNQLGDLKIKIECDGKVSFKKKGILRKNHSGKKISFSLKENKQGNLTLSKEINHCELTINDKDLIKLTKDQVAFPFLKELNNAQENCAYSNPKDLVFLTNSYPMMTCANEASDIEILADSEDGLLTKIESLLGMKPSVEFIRNLNPYAELDFSQAPQLDAIFVSTLLYRHDFSGTVIARLLKFHADRGTLVNIVGTGYMHEEKDKALLRELTQYNSNIRVQEYKYIDSNRGLKAPMRYLDNYLRDMHVKMFVTLSSKHLENNILITGGRNIHDGFVFSEKPDFSKYPELDQSPEGAYAYWNDLEIKIISPQLARSVYSHLLKFWNRENIGQVMSDIQVSNKAKIKKDGDEVLASKATMMRHIISLPFNDDHALEDLYVEMIDKAKTSIKLSSPYLRPTKLIMKAIERAIKRNIDITIQTRIDLQGDTQAWLYEETNKAAINSLYDKIKIFEWTENSILHTKMLLVDGEYAFLGSVNLSRRSFIQDVENGFVIHGEDFVQKLTETFVGYNKRSKQISSKQKRKFFASLIVNILQDQF